MKSASTKIWLASGRTLPRRCNLRYQMNRHGTAQQDCYASTSRQLVRENMSQYKPLSWINHKTRIYLNLCLILIPKTIPASPLSNRLLIYVQLVKNASLKAKPASDNILKWIFNPQSNHPLMRMIQPQFVQQCILSLHGHYLLPYALWATRFPVNASLHQSWWITNQTIIWNKQ